MKTKESKQWKIAVIGVRGSGKTTLAAGLFASSDEHFTVGAGDDTTRSYLERFKSDLQDGHWPDSTLEAERPTLNLYINQGNGRITPIVFEDYMGERVFTDVNFIDDIVGSPDGAILLFNPGMDILSDTRQRNAMVSLYSRIIDHLRQCGCRHVVFAVTAADRLDGDLKDRAEDILGYEREITNYLQTVGEPGWWKRIPVTVTGRLASQDNASLAKGTENTASLPFRYIIDKLCAETARHQLRKTALRFGLLALLAAIGLTVALVFMYRSERKWLDGMIDGMSSFMPEAGNSPLVQAGESAEDLRSRLDGISARKPWFYFNRKLWEATTNEWTNQLELRTARYIDLQIDELVGSAETNGTDSAIAKLSQVVSSFNPQNDVKLKEDLAKKWSTSETIIRVIHDRANAKSLAKELLSKTSLVECIEIQRAAMKWEPLPENKEVKKNLLTQIDARCIQFADAEWKSMDAGSWTNATEQNVNRFALNVRSWEPTSAEALSVHSNLLGRLPDTCMLWCTRFKIRFLEDLRAGERITIKDILPALAETAFVPMSNNCSVAAIEDSAGKLFKARGRLLDRCLSIFAENEWPSESDAAPPSRWKDSTIADWDESGQVISCLSSNELARATESLAEMRAKSVAAWFARQKQLSDIFIKKIKDMPVQDACTEYQMFCSDHAFNPGLNITNGNVRTAFIEKVKVAFADYIASYKNDFVGDKRIYLGNGSSTDRIKEAEDKFAAFSNLCILLAADVSGTMTETAYYKFAVKAAPELKKGMYGAFQKKLLISSAHESWSDVSIDGPDHFLRANVSLSCYVYLAGTARNIPLGDSLDISILYNDWQQLSFGASVSATFGGKWTTGDTETDSFSFGDKIAIEKSVKKDGPSDICLRAGYVSLTETNTFLRDNHLRCTLSFNIKFSIEGKGFLDLVNEYFAE